MKRRGDTQPMGAENLHVLVDREYASAGAYQWVRELFANSWQASASRVEFGVEWQAVKEDGVYRMVVVDDGEGMTRRELERFFNSIGASGRQIGAADENFGIGAKVSLVPWNPEGVVIVTMQDSEVYAAWMKRDEVTGEYGLKEVWVEGEGRVTSWPVYPGEEDEDLGIDLAALFPEWVGDSGTAVLLLGDTSGNHTLLGDPRRDSRGTRGAWYALTERFWEVPGDVKVRSYEMRSEDPSKWPTEYTARADDGGQWRAVKGAAKETVDPKAETGNLTLADGSVLRWWINPPPKQKAYAHQTPFIGALYAGEVYETSRKSYRYRNQFGIGFSKVWDRVGILIEPPRSAPNRTGGAFPNSSRNALLWDVAGEARPLPWGEWGEEFVERMPDAIKKLINAQVKPSGRKMSDRLAMVAERFRMKAAVAAKAGTVVTSLTRGTQLSNLPTGKRSGVKTRRRSRRLTAAGQTAGVSAGTGKAKQKTVQTDLPKWQPAEEGDVTEGMVAVYNPEPAPGLVLLEVDHPVIEEQVRHWTLRFPTAPGPVREVVTDIYGSTLVAAVAHSEWLAKDAGVSRKVVDDEVRSEAGLTAAALGLWLQDEVIQRELKRQLGKAVKPKAA